MERRRNPQLSVVVPVYRCSECLRPLVERLEQSLETVTPSWEIIFVDDRSPDDSWSVLNDLARSNPAIHAYRLSRNFGQHAAITAGLSRAQGSWAVVMDCDLQDPPELIPKLYEKAREGNDIVLARRRGRPSLGRRTLSRAYSGLMKLFFGVEMSGEFANLSLISRKVIDSFLELRDLDRHYILILRWLGFDQAAIEFEQPERYAGRSSYTLRSLIRLGLDGMFFQTTTLLHWIIYLGFAVAAAGLLLAVVFVYIYLTHQPFPLPGWTSLSILILVMGGFIVITTGVTGLYIGKIFQQVKGRPLFVFDEEESEVADEIETPKASRSR
jgi:polyisoprenyl-phosphate glycosyltransferase